MDLGKWAVLEVVGTQSATDVLSKTCALFRWVGSKRIGLLCSEDHRSSHGRLEVLLTGVHWSNWRGHLFGWAIRFGTLKKVHGRGSQFWLRRWSSLVILEECVAGLFVLDAEAGWERCMLTQTWAAGTAWDLPTGAFRPTKWNGSSWRRKKLWIEWEAMI